MPTPCNAGAVFEILLIMVYNRTESVVKRCFRIKRDDVRNYAFIRSLEARFDQKSEQIQKIQIERSYSKKSGPGGSLYFYEYLKCGAGVSKLVRRLDQLVRNLIFSNAQLSPTALEYDFMRNNYLKQVFEKGHK